MGAKRYQRWAACFDNHGDRQDDKAVKAFKEFCGWFKPEIRIHGGDCWDFRCLRKGANDEEKREGFKGDLDHGLDFVGWYKPTKFLRGNHDERLWDLVKCDDGKIQQYSRVLIDQIEDALKGVEIFPYNKRNGVLRLGHLKMVHGYHSGITAAKLAATIYGSVIMGHVHAIDQYSIPGLERRVGRTVGCMCLLEQDYNRAQANTLRQAHGWAYGMLYPNGDYICWQAEQVNGRWVLPSEFKELS